VPQGSAKIWEDAMKIAAGLVLALFLLSAPNFASAQVTQAPILVWNIGGVYDFSGGETEYVYKFAADFGPFLESNFGVLENFVISSDLGVITFKGQHLTKGAPAELLIGSLRVKEQVGEVKIFAASADIDGKPQNLTANIREQLKTPLPIINGADGEKSRCPDKTLDFKVYEGKFLEQDCGDYCHATFSLNNKQESFMFEPQLEYFFANEKNNGRVVKFIVKTLQSWSPMDPEGHGYECRSEELITEFVAK
jgi:hypothetical protein